MEPLRAAVRGGDARAVHALLDAGADPETTEEHGTPVLCLAVDTFDLEVVEALVTSARLDRVAPDGRTALLRAVDRGAHAITEQLIAHGAAMWHTDAEGRDALALARYWHETGAVEVLRRRTGGRGPVGRRTVVSGEETVWEELSSGDAPTVRTGHGAILTDLEPRFGITVPFAELLSRALAEPDVDHGVWWETTYVLQQRHDVGVWTAAAALRARPDPRERYFGAELLRLIHLLDESDEEVCDEPLTDLFLPWVAEETDPRVVRALTAGLAEARDPRAVGRLPALTAYPDARVRQRAVGGLYGAVAEGAADALAAVVERAADAEAAVRRVACTVLGAAPPAAEAASQALAARLADADEGVRVEAAVRLALRDDPRGDDVIAALDGSDAAAEGGPYHWLLYDVYRHRARVR
ncbi:ankyrin repeat domain-containing protein [Streptomyces sp. NPDC026673]|uniref:ankyrin repeat domain-containing protein n=1 Tax=Streptomyces sp. NPDC026673 TaxID=3155724 RepID=UPI0033E83EFD